MNEKLMQYLAGNEGKYPHLLEAKFPRITGKIVELWDSSRKITDYFSDLMIDKRGTRKGFPPDIAREIFVLSVFYENVWAKEHKAGDIWGAGR